MTMSKTKKPKAKHLEDLPDQGLSIMNNIAQPLLALCPACRLKMLGFMCSIAINQITESEQRDYVIALWEEIKTAHNNIEPVTLQ